MTGGSRSSPHATAEDEKKRGETLLPAAIDAFQRGQYEEAKALCRQILRERPDIFDALHLLGVLEIDGPRVDEAETVLRRAVKVQPRSAEAHSNLGLACFKLGKFEEARKCQETAIALNPKFPTALTNLGNVLMRLRRYAPAVDAHDRAIRIRPDYADAYNNRGMALLSLGRLAEADASFDRALSLQPRHVAALVGKAAVSLQLRNLDAAQRALDMASATNPNIPEVLAHRARLNLALGKLDETEHDLDAALAIDPDLEIAWLTKAHYSILTNRIAQAMHACHKVLEKNPESEIALAHLGTCHGAQGEVTAAVQLFDRALAIMPDFDDAMLRKIFTLEFAEDADFAAHQAVRREWWERIGAKLPRQQLREPNCDPEKRIRVGYVSSDFRHHSAALTFLPILRHHDHRQFEIIAYSCSSVRDKKTELFETFVDGWVDASDMSEEELADRIARDRIDILVDLSGHSAGHRLAVFARKPAPVQVSACGSVTGSGLATMDYLLADPVFVPREVRHLFAEEIYDLPCGITIDGLPEARETELPMLRNGFATFGVFNRIEKISEGAIRLWSAILEQIPRSRIVVKNMLLADARTRDTLLGRFAAHGIADERVTCLGATTHVQHLAEFANIDMSLDPFPQNGGVSTWESLQMGVPVICKLGRSACSRAGGAIVKAVGLDDWVADSENGYIEIARKFASQSDELRALRAALPASVANSNAGNTEFYTRRVEDGYRQFWRRYCTAHQRGAPSRP